MQSSSDPTILTRPIASGTQSATAGDGSGLDRRLPKKRFTPKRVALGVGALALVALLVWLAAGGAGGQRLRVEGDRLTIATVTEDAFQEYIAVTGTVQPERTIYLDAVVGGQVRERVVDEGAFVKAGDPLLVLKNDNLALQTMSGEAQITEQVYNIRNSRLALDQNQLNLSQQLTELDYNLSRAEREHDRLKTLFDKGVVSQQDYQAARDERDYLRRRRDLTLRSHRADSLSRVAQLQQMESSMSRLNRNLTLLESSMENLVVRAPVDGQLTSLDAEIGELKGQGARLGQIDILGRYRVRVPIDEHYVARVAVGQQGSVPVRGTDYTMTVRKVYPEVRDGRFEVDLAFEDAVPDDLRRGQSLRIRLELGDPEQALLLPRGGFFTTTGGQWVYRLEGDGEAVRQPVTLGRQNPLSFEVLDGLRPGDRVIVSSYEAFGNADRLVLR